MVRELIIYLIAFIIIIFLFVRFNKSHNKEITPEILAAADQFKVDTETLKNRYISNTDKLDLKQRYLSTHEEIVNWTQSELKESSNLQYFWHNYPILDNWVEKNKMDIS